MEQIKETTFTNELSYHIEVRLLLEVYTHSHVQDYIWVPQLVEHLDLFDKIFEGLPGHIAFSKLLDSNFGAHPLCFKDITVATPANQIRASINL